MRKIAFLFPGQGSQFAGMGRSLAETHAAARQVFEEADGVLGFPLSRLCFEGPDQDLKLTENTQPALLACSIAAFRVLEQRGVMPGYVAGHSLGEYSALVAAGSLTLADALRLVRRRGRYMQEAVPPGAGAMAALLKLPAGRLEEILAQAAGGEVVSAANFNSPDQVVIAGHKGAVERAAELARSAGARRAVMLPVSAPFHCPLMRPAQQKMATELNAVGFRDLRWPLINNCRAAEIRDAAGARSGLIEQISAPVRWSDSVRRLASSSVTTFIEVGPGAVLTGLLRTIEPGASGLRFGEAADWEKLSQALGHV
ncbi:MAG: ACP S-malonyltransferase [Acidobacteria bacterium]|nr:ACP S-malonyltransferase [Acidobacteriota bacterium]